jgi:uncharacterized protein YndB with AHSA1/START domain
MQNANAANNDTASRQIVTTRTINAPCELVYKVWTDIDHVDKWWGPDGFSNETKKMDVRPGGEWEYIMHGPNNTDYPNHVAYKVVIPNERLEYVHGAFAGDPDAFNMLVTFEAQGDKTLLTMRHTFKTVEYLKMVVEQYGANEGAKQTLDKMEAYLAAEDRRELSITREFDAPIELVFDAMTQPEHLMHWWGPKGLKMKVAKVDLHPGGSFHYAMDTPDGSIMWGKFVYREIVRPERLVFVNSFSDEAGNITRHPMAPDWPLEMLNVLTLTEQNGKTTLNLKGRPINATKDEIEVYHSNHSSMQGGFKGTYDQLDTYLKTIQQ